MLDARAAESQHLIEVLSTGGQQFADFGCELLLCERGLDALLHLLQREGRTEYAGGRGQRIQLGFAPFALTHAIRKADEAPPLPFAEHRQDRGRDNAFLLQNRLLALREIHPVADDRVATPEDFYPAPTACFLEWDMLQHFEG